MGKIVADSILDAALIALKANTKMTACSAQPTTFAEANSSFVLADAAVSSADFTIANGDTNGRKVTIGAKSSILIDVTGNANHIALVDGSSLLYVTTCTSQSLTANASNTVNFPAWDIEIADPT